MNDDGKNGRVGLLCDGGRISSGFDLVLGKGSRLLTRFQDKAV